ncbi:olfactory receptor 5B21-like [Hyperolius riggenbachi]|uniref:olfactory receptor 5B21-like n=1 Tax=Hyperolius riggenbachi TaxID=752182 RepID=UPI0035A2A701
MDIGNNSQVTEFVFSGLTNDQNLIPFLFTFFLLVYMVTVLGNIGLMIVVHVSANLHTPMYFFLSHLSAVDLFYSSAVTPKMLSDLISLQKTISFIGCAVQFLFFAGLAGTEVLLLASMSYDRYTAVCYPLHYVTIMTTKKCFILVSLSFSFGFFQALVQTTCLFSLEYCESNLIDHFYCDVPPMLQLSCSETLLCNMLTVFFVGSYCFLSLSTILVTYTLIFSAVLHISSSEGRVKAFNTCSSHLMCSTVFYVSVFFTYLHSPSSVLKKQDKVASVFYTVVTPMLNPLFYSLRNQEVKRAIIQAIHIIL